MVGALKRLSQAICEFAPSMPWQATVGRVRALDALAGYRRALREELRRRVERRADAVVSPRRHAVAEVLVRARRRHDRAVDRLRVVGEVVSGELAYLGEHRALASGVKHGKLLFLFVGRDVLRHVHALAVELNYLFVDSVDFFAKFLKFL